MRKIKKFLIKILLFFISIVLFLKIFFLKGIFDTQKNDDFLFLRLLSNNFSNSNYQTKKEYKFKINYRNMDFKSIDLSKTINSETLVYEKIAPGTSGSFDILLNSNQDLRYRVEFYSINKKPQNLNFLALKNGKYIATADTLEELSDKLLGYIKKNEEVVITVQWFWKFENEENIEDSDLQDTVDAQRIKQYQFNICTIGEEFA